MNLIEKIINSNTDEEINTLITEAINQHNDNSTRVEQLGFLENGKFNHIFKGFIGLNTRIKYENLSMETYGMKTTDFFYEFAHFIKKNNVTNKLAFIYNLEFFINQYFGYPKNTGDQRRSIFNDRAFNTTSTDEEYFQALQNNKIGDLKGLGLAQCTEKGALAQQLLSIFDIESYYCMGAVSLNNGQEAHCFNIIKRKNDYALLDFSCPVTSYTKDGKIKGYYPFVEILSNEEFEEFVNNGEIKSFEEYEYIDNQKQPLDSRREYIVGSFRIEKNQGHVR